MNYIGFWKRAFAYTIDITLVLLLMPIMIPILKYSYLNRTIIPLVLITTLSYVVWIYFICRFGGTPGKMILKMRIVNQKYEKITIDKAILRTLLYLVSSIISLMATYFAISNMPESLNNFKEISMYIRTNKGLFTYVDNYLIVLMLIDALIIITNRKKRTGHDFLADSYVVNLRELQKTKNANTAL